MEIIKSIQYRIVEIRGERVMLDFDLASLYSVGTKVLNQAVKRNSKRFPKDFMFRLKAAEWNEVRSQFVTGSAGDDMRSQVVTASQRQRNAASLPYAFTEQGVAMLSGILNSDKAIQMNIAIMRAFVEIRRIALQTTNWKSQLDEIREHLGGHDAQLNHIYDALENLLDDQTGQKKWEDRERIGFKKD